MPNAPVFSSDVKISSANSSMWKTNELVKIAAGAVVDRCADCRGLTVYTAQARGSLDTYRYDDMIQDLAKCLEG